MRNQILQADLRRGLAVGMADGPQQGMGEEMLFPVAKGLHAWHVRAVCLQGLLQRFLLKEHMRLNLI